MTTLLLRCAGPMQSWGTRSRFDYRDTERTPSKSGIVGLLASALGREREDSVADLAGLMMAVRVDRPGRVETDFHTAQAVARASGKVAETVVTRRDYLADANFLVALEGAPELLGACHAALGAPRRPLFLGRRGYAPSPPPFIPDGVIELAPLEALRQCFWPTDGKGLPAKEVTAELECQDGEPGDLRWDVPESFVTHDRRFGSRRVRQIRLVSSTAHGKGA